MRTTSEDLHFYIVVERIRQAIRPLSKEAAGQVAIKVVDEWAGRVMLRKPLDQSFGLRCECVFIAANRDLGFGLSRELKQDPEWTSEIDKVMRARLQFWMVRSTRFYRGQATLARRAG